MQDTADSVYLMKDAALFELVLEVCDLASRDLGVVFVVGVRALELGHGLDREAVVVVERDRRGDERDPQRAGSGEAGADVGDGDGQLGAGHGNKAGEDNKGDVGEHWG